MTKDDGTEERIAVLGEPFRDVSPGFLPRTLDELRAGQERSAADERQHIVIQEQETTDGPSLEETLDQMFEDAETEGTTQQAQSTRQETDRTNIELRSRIAGQAMTAAVSRNREYQNRRIAALRRELHRMRNGIERVIAGLRDLGEDVPDHTEATNRLNDLGRTLDMISGTEQGHDADSTTPAAANSGVAARERGMESLHRRLHEAQLRLEDSTRTRSQAVHELHTAESNLSEARRVRDDAADVLASAESELDENREHVSQLRREQRTAENYIRIFGSREDMERQGAEYESPIGGMFNRAWERFRQAEETRREERTLRQVLDDEQRVHDATRRPNEGEQAEQLPAANTPHEDQLNEYYAMLRRQEWTQQPPPSSNEPNFPTNMLNAVRQLDEEEQAARQQFMASLGYPSQPAATGPQRLEPERLTVLDRLLQHTSEPDRSAIIQRMVENGTAQALQTTPTSPLNLWRRLQEAHPPATYSSSESDDGERQGLDVEDDGRPEPKEDEDLVIKMDCRVCYTQVADVACLPCGHLVMCQWCSEQHSPVMEHDKTRPRRPANCPVCRKRVKQKVRIYRS